MTKPSKRKKVLLIAGSVVVLFMLAQTITYCLLAERFMTPHMALRGLSDYGLLREMDYVVVDASVWDGLTEHQKQSLTEELGRYVRTIYYSLDEVPEDRITWEPITAKDRGSYERYSRANHAQPETLSRWKREIDAGRRIAAFNKGVFIRWKREDAGLFLVRCTSSLWVSLTGVEARSDVYLWLLGGWIRLYTESHAMT